MNRAQANAANYRNAEVAKVVAKQESTTAMQKLDNAAVQMTRQQQECENEKSLRLHFERDAAKFKQQVC